MLPTAYQPTSLEDGDVEVLVEEEWLDVNRMDIDVLLANHWGPPIAHADKGKGGEDAVRYLLARGADPRLRIIGAMTMRLVWRSHSETMTWSGS